MANMKLIDTKTVGAGGIASITFSIIPQTYTDLRILVSARDDRAGQPNTDLSLRVGYNGTINTGSIYSNIQLYGNGSAAGSQSSSTDYAYLGMSNGPTSTANVFGSTEIYITNYTSSNNKSVTTLGASENNAQTAFSVANANLISTSNPITDVQISAVYGSGLFVQGSTFYLYGISNTIATGGKAYGGIVTEDDDYMYHTFLSSGVFTPTVNLTCDYLVIAAGGGGGGIAGSNLTSAAGGAGGLRSTVGATGGGGSLESPLSLTSGTGYAVTIGAGGPAGIWPNRGTAGGNSVFSTITSTGGGGGGAYDSSTQPNGGSGGSGGGGAHRNGTGGAGTSGQGYAGGTGASTNSNGSSGGGGGAGAVGANATDGDSAAGGAGGIGVQIATLASATLTGVNNYYAGGGGGGTVGTSIATGGSGGGGNGATQTLAGVTGTINTGGGGGGGAHVNNGTINDRANYAGAGASGLVIVRYAK
jgi:hypothetical protein